MAEQLQVGVNGAAGPTMDVATAQIRVRWYVGAGDVPGALFRDAANTVTSRFPGPDSAVVLDGAEWLVDLGTLPAAIVRVELHVEFAGRRPAGFVATIGHRTLSHPGVAGEPDQVRLLARIERTGAGWTVVPFDQVVLSESAQPQPQQSHGRLLVVVDSSGSMAGPLSDGRVTAAVVDAIRAAGRPNVAVRASDGADASLRRDSDIVPREVAGFVEQLATRPRRSSSDLVATLQAVGVTADDDLVVVTDAPPSDVAAVQAVLGDREATWLVIGSPALAGMSADRRRWSELTASGRVQRRLSGVG